MSKSEIKEYSRDTFRDIRVCDGFVHRNALSDNLTRDYFDCQCKFDDCGSRSFDDYHTFHTTEVDNNGGVDLYRTSNNNAAGFHDSCATSECGFCGKDDRCPNSRNFFSPDRGLRCYVLFGGSKLDRLQLAVPSNNFAQLDDCWRHVRVNHNGRPADLLE